MRMVLACFSAIDVMQLSACAQDTSSTCVGPYMQSLTVVALCLEDISGLRTSAVHWHVWASRRVLWCASFMADYIFGLQWLCTTTLQRCKASPGMANTHSQQALFALFFETVDKPCDVLHAMHGGLHSCTGLVPHVCQAQGSECDTLRLLQM